MALDQALILAALAQGLILFAIGVLLYLERIPRVVRGEVHPRDVALSTEAWPESAQKVSNAYNNQFQMPVLFYVAVVIEIYLGATVPGLVLAWLFVLTRIVHAAIFVTSNRVTRRFFAFIVGAILVLTWWLALIVRLILQIAGA